MRAFAVLLVVFWHTSRTARLLPLGLWGVDLFFVLSGFLITGILLDARDGGSTRGVVLRAFYARRFLRIVPLFYLAVGVTAALAFPGVRGGLLWYLTYLANAFFIVHGWAGYAAHLWSLAVEEQFYLLAPCVLLFTPKRRLPLILTAAIGIAVAYRVGAGAAGWSRRAVILPPLASWDTLGIGALLAVTSRTGRTGWLRATLPLGVPLLAVDAAANVLRMHGHDSHALFATQYSAEGLAAALVGVRVVAGAAAGFGGAAGRLLTFPPLVYIGTISYGIYIYHHLLLYLDDRWHIAAHGGQFAYISFDLVLAIVVAALSWHLFERPLNLLKRYFPYTSRATAVDPAPRLSTAEPR